MPTLRLDAQALRLFNKIATRRQLPYLERARRDRGNHAGLPRCLQDAPLQHSGIGHEDGATSIEHSMIAALNPDRYYRRLHFNRTSIDNLFLGPVASAL
jgi:hypothetical protein